MAGLDDGNGTQDNGGADTSQTGGSYDPNASRRAAVTGYYNNILKRAPDDAGLNGWVNSGLDLGQIQQAFYNSDEYKGLQAAPAPATTTNPSTPDPNAAPSSGTYNDAQLRAQIAQWAAMPGADPSLGNDPNYWVNAINSRGGLSSSNLQYWQDASVGPTAFFNNPDREATHNTTPTAGAPSGGGANGTGPSQVIYAPPPRDPRWDALYNTLLQRSQQSLTVDPNDPAIKAQVDAFRANANNQRLSDMQAAAERGGPYATGLVGNIARTTSEHVGDSTSQFLGSLLANEVAARRKEIQDALNSEGSMLTADQVNQLHIADQQLAAREAEINAQYAQQNFAANQQQQAWEDWFKQYVYGTGGGA